MLTLMLNKIPRGEETDEGGNGAVRFSPWEETDWEKNWPGYALPLQVDSDQMAPNKAM